jgi:hypothetical protein
MQPAVGRETSPRDCRQLQPLVGALDSSVAVSRCYNMWKVKFWSFKSDAIKKRYAF